MVLNTQQEQRTIRLSKRKAMLDAGIPPYSNPHSPPTPIRVIRTRHATSPDLNTPTPTHATNPTQPAPPAATCTSTAPQTTSTSLPVTVCGRVMHIRNTGKLCFVSIWENAQDSIQLMLSHATLGDALDLFRQYVDLGDWISAHGIVGTSKRGELSIMVDSWHMLTKAITPMPNVYKPMAEDARVKKKYINIFIDKTAHTTALLRPVVNSSIRQTLKESGFMELETPILQTIAGGANARPFITHSNAFDIDLYLRIAPELYLKRALVAGLGRVFEINRNFRNEGADSTHSPEFAMLEAYETYGNYNTIATLAEKIIKNAANACLEEFGKQAIPHAFTNGIFQEWGKIHMYPSLSEALGEEITPHTPRAHLAAIAHKAGIPESETQQISCPGKLAEELWEHMVGNSTEGPFFVFDFPKASSPLTAEDPQNPGYALKWDLYVKGAELATGYTELTDPVDQAQRFAQQVQNRQLGDVEAMQEDTDFIQALEHGMPPAGGLGMGVDRLLMALTGLGIRDTILFPLVK